MKKKTCNFIFVFLLLLMIFPKIVNAEESVVSIDDKIYNSLEEASTQLTEGSYMKLLKNIDLSVYDDNYICILNFPNNVVFDLNGFDIKIGWNSQYANGIGNLIFTGNNITVKNGSFSGRPSYTLWIGDEEDTNNFIVEDIRVDGGINIYNSNNVILRRVDVSGHDYYSVWADNNVSVTMESGNYSTSGVYGLIGLSDSNVSSMNIKGGTYHINGNKLIPNKNKPVISGGIFNVSVSDYLLNGYECINKADTFQVRKIVNVSEIEINELDLNQVYEEIVVSGSNLSLIKKVIYDTLYSKDEVDVLNKNLKIKLETNNIDVNNDISSSMNTFLNDSIGGGTILKYFDISINVIDKNTNMIIGNLTELSDKISFTVAIPSELKTPKSGYKRNFYIIRSHNNNYDIIDPVSVKDSKFLTFETDKFSTYALAYFDEKIIENPNTHDDFIKYLITLLISLGVLIVTLVYIKKKNIFGSMSINK